VGLSDVNCRSHGAANSKLRRLGTGEKLYKSAIIVAHRGGGYWGPTHSREKTPVHADSLWKVRKDSFEIVFMSLVLIKLL